MRHEPNEEEHAAKRLGWKPKVGDKVWVQDVWSRPHVVSWIRGAVAGGGAILWVQRPDRVARYHPSRLWPRLHDDD